MRSTWCWTFLLLLVAAAPNHADPIAVPVRQAHRVVRNAAAPALLQLAADEAGVPVKGEPTYRGKPLSEWTRAIQSADHTTRERACRAIWNMGPKAARAIPALILALGHPESYTRALAARALAAIGKDAFVPVVEALGDPEPVVRAYAARALGRFRSQPGAVPVLLEALNDRSEFVRDRAAEALGLLGDPIAVPALEKAMADPVRFVRISAIMALGRMGPKAKPAVPALLRLADGVDKHLTCDAVRTLSYIGDDTAIPRLVELLKQKDGFLYPNLTDALIRFGPRAKQALPILLEGLGDSDPRVRAYSAFALGALGEGEETVKALRAATKDPDVRCRIHAATAYWQLRGDRTLALSVLRDVLKESDEKIGLPFALEAIDLMGPEARDLVPDIQVLLQDQAAAWRDAFICRLPRVGGADSIGLLAAALSDPCPWVRRAAADALGEFGPLAREAGAALVAALKDSDPSVADAALDALERIDAAAKAG
jgi:HEAT repeat protein